MATMNTVRALMKKAGTGFLATTDGRRPAVRPMSAYFWVGKELWMATSGKSGKIADLRKKKAVEFCCMTGDFAFARVIGACTISSHPADKRKMFAAFKWMKNYFTSVENPGWVVLRIKPTCVLYMSADVMEYEKVKLK